jgi:oligoendopeptidase F
MTGNLIANRSDLDQNDTWDLSKLFAQDQDWEQALKNYEKQGEAAALFKGTLSASAERLADYLDFAKALDILEERLNYYSDLRQTEDEGDAKGRAMTGRFMMAAAKREAACAWAAPELQAIPDGVMETFLAHPRLGEYRIYLHKLLRYKPYILSDKEERLLALYREAESVSHDAFSVLTNVDIDFGALDTPEGARPLSQSTWSVFMENPDRGLRRRAYEAFYRCFGQHKHTLAALYSGSVKQDVIKARVRGFSSSRAAHLFPDDVPEAVYDNLVAAVNDNLAPLHHYYRLRKKALELDSLRHYDVYAPLVPKAAPRTPWGGAVDLIAQALHPLGGEYVDTLRAGLLGRWADRYENKGKRSGAFSAGSYTGDPYILMNYKEDSVRDVFTLAHEGGHSMHSWYSARANPFPHYRYTIFEAEVASTFNEELLFRHWTACAGSGELKAYLINKRLDDLVSTLYRQTMFAEYERRTHQLEEAGTALTLEVLREEYRSLLEKYFGPEMVLEESSDLEGLRIPHFYRAFYVYKYATGISAALALAERVLSGGKAERDDYFAFLRSGGSCFPLESLKRAGVDMSGPEPITAACGVFRELVARM